MSRVLDLLKGLAGGKQVVGCTPHDVVFGENKWKLLRYRGRRSRMHPMPVLMVPSLINRHYVLDLLPQRSFAAYMVAQGHEVYIIDWGTPGDEDRYLTFDTICDRYLGRATRLVSRASEERFTPRVSLTSALTTSASRSPSSS